MINDFNVCEVLPVLKEGRQKLVFDIIERRNVELFQRIFRFEDNERLLRLVFEQYSIESVNRQIIAGYNSSNEVGRKVVQSLKTVLEHVLQMQAGDGDDIGNVLPNLVEEKIILMDSLIQLDLVTESKLNEIKFMIERDNAIYNRLWKQMEGEK